MKDFAKTRLISQTLNKLAKDDFVAKEIIDYYEQLHGVVKSGKLVNKKLKDKDNIEDFVSFHILINFKKLCPSNSLKNYYERISNLVSCLGKNFSLTMELAIILRIIEILKKISNRYGYDEISRFFDLLEASREKEDQLLYIVYYGLFDGTIINDHMVDNDIKVKSDVITEALLNNDEKLPDSIIMHLCHDEQFKGFDPQVILFLIQQFFMFRLNMKLEDDDMLDVIQKIFNNNVRDFNTEAEFLDLSELINEVNEYFNGNANDDFVTHFLEIVNGIETLDRKDDGKKHGTI